MLLVTTVPCIATSWQTQEFQPERHQRLQISQEGVRLIEETKRVPKCYRIRKSFLKVWSLEQKGYSGWWNLICTYNNANKQFGAPAQELNQSTDHTIYPPGPTVNHSASVSMPVR
jgi:hypothetical protein